MNHFRYLARDRAGTLTRGTQLAESPQRLQALLEATGLSLVSFSTSHDEVDHTAPGNTTALARLSQLGWLGWWRPGARSIELALKQLAMMLRSGLDLRGSLQTVLEQTSSLALARSVRMVIQRVENGQTLQAALASTNVFPELVVQLVGVGEATGNLSEVLERAAQHMATRRASIHTVRMALAYPLLVATAAVSIAIYLVVAVIPELQKMLTAMGRRAQHDAVAGRSFQLAASAWFDLFGTLLDDRRWNHRLCLLATGTIRHRSLGAAFAFDWIDTASIG